ncbi:MAG: sodium:solute symporter, partial [Eubacterium sp.]
LWTDFIQGCVLIVGVVFSLVYLVASIDGGMGAITATLANGKFLSDTQSFIDPQIWKDSILIILIGAGFNTFSSYVSSQDIVQRFTTTTDVKKLNKMMLTNGALSIFIATVFYLIGTGLYVFYGQNPSLAQTAQQDQIFGSFIAYQLPVGITGILLAAIYAASQSTLSTGLNSVATSWTLDIQTMVSKKSLSFKTQTRIAQFITLGVGILSIVVAIILANGEIKSAYEWFNGFMGLVLGVLGGTFVLGAFTKKATNVGAYVAFAVSAILVVFLKYSGAGVSIWSYSIISILVSLIVGYVASLVHRKLVPEQQICDIRTTIFYHKGKDVALDQERAGE